MVIEASLENELTARDSRTASRRRLHLETPGTTGSGRATNVKIHDISESGLLLQTSAHLAIGERIEVELPHSGATPAKVVWESGELRGCQFDKHISQASISAAQLQSRPLGLASPVEDDSADDLHIEQEESFGARLRRLRKERKISLIGFARLLGVSKPTVWKWERNEVRPRRKSIAVAASVLGVSDQELVFGGKQVHASTSAEQHNASHQLGDVIGACKERIAEAAGTSADNVSVTIKI